VFKHDFFAATGLYVNGCKHVVVKLGRVRPFLGVPLDWIGRALVQREKRFYRLLDDLPGIPKLVPSGRPDVLLHDYVEGVELDKHAPIPDTFFDDLQRLFRRLHDRGIAYVDSDKPGNIIVGEDGCPHLIDFQLSFGGYPPGSMRAKLAARVFRRLALEDLYHVRKHKRRLRPDQTTDEERSQTRPSLAIRLHRRIARPLKYLRRYILVKLGLRARMKPRKHW